MGKRPVPPPLSELRARTIEVGLSAVVTPSPLDFFLNVLIRPFLLKGRFLELYELFPDLVAVVNKGIRGAGHRKVPPLGAL